MTTFEVHRVESTHEVLGDDEITPEGRKEPIIHVFGYDDDRNWHHEKIRGFESYCYVAYKHREWAKQHDDVKYVQTRKNDGSKYESVRGKRLVRCYTYDTNGPGNLSDAAKGDAPIKQTWESDVLFSNRFIADMDLESGIEVPEHDGEYVHVDSTCTCTSHNEWRIHYVDIEVNDRNGFPENGTQNEEPKNRKPRSNIE